MKFTSDLVVVSVVLPLLPCSGIFFSIAPNAVVSIRSQLLLAAFVASRNVMMMFRSRLFDSLTFEMLFLGLRM